MLNINRLLAGLALVLLTNACSTPHWDYRTPIYNAAAMERSTSTSTPKWIYQYESQMQQYGQHQQSQVQTQYVLRSNGTMGIYVPVSSNMYMQIE